MNVEQIAIEIQQNIPHASLYQCMQIANEYLKNNDVQWLESQLEKLMDTSMKDSYAVIQNAQKGYLEICDLPFQTIGQCTISFDIDTPKFRSGIEYKVQNFVVNQDTVSFRYSGVDYTYDSNIVVVKIYANKSAYSFDIESTPVKTKRGPIQNTFLDADKVDYQYPSNSEDSQLANQRQKISSKAAETVFLAQGGMVQNGEIKSGFKQEEEKCEAQRRFASEHGIKLPIYYSGSIRKLMKEFTKSV